ncbi:MAG TPA: glycerol-3-phosphate acyltransferase, partial [Accumulibacter sp.]|nr:glycerol-3-phosphate acyltransferase [Accumulibacter sp.]
MPPFLISSLAVIAAYLLGSFSFALIASRLFGLADPRTYGSKNPGATNVLRSGHRGAAIVTLLGDVGKGWLAVFLANHYVADGTANVQIVGLVAVAVFLGHLFPVFLGFKGGKGVATAAGVLLAINPWLGLATLATWLLIA